MTEGRALIWGVSGQDGAYLARLLVDKGYCVVGTTRRIEDDFPANLTRLGLGGSIDLRAVDPTDAAAVNAVVADVRPAEIYYLAAQSSVWRSFQEPGRTVAASAVGIANVLAAAAPLGPRVLAAASGDCFGETPADRPAAEGTPFAPRSPYAAAKCAAHHLVAASRIAGGQFACSAFLFNHESPLRPETFALGKVIAAVKRIAAGSDETLELGNVEVVRDWGWAPEYVEAMWLMLQQEQPRDFVIATGRSHRLADLVARCFEAVGLDWNRHVRVSAAPPRPSDIVVHHADPGEAERRLGWKARVGLDELGARLVRG